METSSSTPSTPTAARLTRVETVMTSDPVLKARLSKKSVSVVKRGGDTVTFAPEVMAVAVAMQDKGVDPCAAGVSKEQIVEAAMAVLEISDQPDAETKKASQVQPDEAKKDKAHGKTHDAGETAPPRTVNHVLSVYTLLLSAIQLARHEDKSAGAANRLEKLEAVAADFRKTLS